MWQAPDFGAVGSDTRSGRARSRGPCRVRGRYRAWHPRDAPYVIVNASSTAQWTAGSRPGRDRRPFHRFERTAQHPPEPELPAETIEGLRRPTGHAVPEAALERHLHRAAAGLRRDAELPRGARLEHVRVDDGGLDRSGLRPVVAASLPEPPRDPRAALGDLSERRARARVCRGASWSRWATPSPGGRRSRFRPAPRPGLGSRWSRP
jgi:hypothetical protein